MYFFQSIQKRKKAKQKAKKMNLNPMVDDNTENQKTNFTVSVDAKNGITTKIT